MEVEKIIRILTVSLVVLAFALKVVERLPFGEASLGCDLPIAIVLPLCVGSIWRRTAKKEENPTD